MAYKRSQESLGINPDPRIWIDVKTKEGWYRKRKPKVKPKLNPVFQEHNIAQAESMPAAMRILNRLEEWTRGFELGRIHMMINSKLKKSYLEDGKISFKYLLRLDIQPKRTLKQLLIQVPYASVTDEVMVKILISDQMIKVKKSIFTDYFFELIMLWGDPTKERGLRVDSVESPIFSKKIIEAEDCVLRINIPSTRQPWMCLLKAGCIEGNEMAKHPRHYGMKVIAVGGGQI